jgi:hypothetical protein
VKTPDRRKLLTVEIFVRRETNRLAPQSRDERRCGGCRLALSSVEGGEP